jgi:hypothetical protein
MSNLRAMVALASGLLLITSSPVAAADATAHRHFGFFLRLDAEAGYLSSSASSNGTEASVKGPAGGLGIGIGGAIAENVILFGHLYDAIAINPTISVGTQSAGTSNTSAGTVGYGGGITWYIMPANFYLSGTVAFTRLTSTSNGSTSNTNWGPGGRVAIGTEWWVSDHWGLGIAAQLSFGFNPDSGATNAPTWTTIAPTIAFSATFN